MKRDLRGNSHLAGTLAARRLADGQGWSISEFTCTAGPSDRPFEERHEDVTVAAVIEGSFKYSADMGEAILHPGAFLLGNSGSCYRCGHDHSAGDRCIALHFAPDYFSEIAASAAGSSRFKFSAAMLPALPQILPWLARIEAQAPRADRLDLDESAPEFIEAVISAASGLAQTRVRPSAREEQQISGVLRYVELHGDHEVGLDVLARMAAMSKYHFLRVFRRCIGMTPYQFVLGARLRRAAVRLATSAEPVSAIALETGFGDLSTFNRRFKNVFGVSPTAYRGFERTVSPTVRSAADTSGCRQS